jgi:hypothetical protein
MQSAEASCHNELIILNGVMQSAEASCHNELIIRWDQKAYPMRNFIGAVFGTWL